MGENSWLIVALQASAIIESVGIVSAMIRSMEAFYLRARNNFQDGGVGSSPCQLNVNIPADINAVHVQCPSGLKGRFETVNTQGIDIIQICEFELHGYIFEILLWFKGLVIKVSDKQKWHMQ